MSRTLTEATITTRNARSKLPEGTHWRAIDPDIHLGYRKGARGGRWLVRWYKGEQSYAQATLATADDALPADGADVLDFAQAAARAKDHVHRQRVEDRATATGPMPTVQDAITDYLKVREAREHTRRGSAGGRRDARTRLTRHVSPRQLAGTLLHELDTKALRRWLGELPANLSQATIRRLVNDLRAALNHAGRQHRDRLPADFAATVREGLRVTEPQSAPARRQVLPDADVRRLIAASWEADRAGQWEGDLARMVVVLAATGARFSQVARMKVSDVQVDECRLMVPVSFKGKGTKRVEHVAVRVGDDVIDALRPAVNGRVGSAPLLERWRNRQVSVAEWVRDGRAAWNSASELNRPWKEIVVKAGMPADTLPYALRHSSIVRGLRAHLPVRLVAAIHDTSSAMIEKHYAAFVVDALDELAARAVVPLVAPPAQVVPVRRPAAS